MVRFKMNNLNRKIKLYADGPDLSEINKKIIFNLDGYTFNPSLFRKLGVKNYLDFCKKIIENAQINQYLLRYLEMMRKQCLDKH